MSAQFDHALSEAAATMDSFGGGWDDSVAEEDDGDDFLPLEFQLADIERAVDSMLLERDRFLSSRAGTPPGKAV
jgi:hypothetical protein